MVNLRIPRTATFAWSPNSSRPIIATGTVAGAVDADFSNATHLELWDLGLEDGVSENLELSPKASISTESRFHDIAWGTRGIIAGGLENGSLDLWNADALYNGESDVLVSQTTKHTGSIKALQFNPFKSELLLTAGVKGEIYVWDLNNTANPFLLGNRAQRADDFSSVDWNKKIPHILLSGGKNGLVTVWDVKQKKESLTLSHLGRREVSAVAWHPDNATKLLTALPDDSNPVIMVWDLRNANAPEKILKGHEQGVLSLDWCKDDTDILLSSGKDNKTICWNPNSGELLGEFPIGTNWMFQTRLNPRNPDILASASFDGKIMVQALQNKKWDAPTDVTSGPLDGEDFFNKASFDPQGPSFSLKQAPKWYKRPVGASFGFGGKLVSFTTPEAAAGQPKKSVLKISKFAVESEVSASTEAFETALKDKNFTSLCDKRIEESTSDDEKEEWTILKNLFDSAAKKKIIEFLGFKAETESDVLPTPTKTNEEASGAKDLLLNGASKATNRLSSFFADGNAEGDEFLSEISSTKGARTNNPFSIFTGTESDADKAITRALILGQFEKAVDVAISEERLSDAFMLAALGGSASLEKVQKAYFAKKAGGPNYLRLLASVVGKNLWDVVHNADLGDWKEVLATLCTYADDKEFPDLCDALGERLEEEQKLDNDIKRRHEAATVYLSGLKLEKVVNIWIEEYHENEKKSLDNASGDETSFSIHVKSLQQLIEKVTVFREATKFVDSDLKATSGWKLAPLYDIYTEYADVVASQGLLDVAAKYLDLVPNSYPAAEIARNRVKHASGKETTKKPAAGRQLPVTGPTARNQTRSPYPAPQAAQPSLYTPAVPAASPYPTQTQPSNPSPYTPQTQTTSVYTPQGATTTPALGGYQPSQPQTGYRPPYGGYTPQTQTPSLYGGPPSGPPASQFNRPPPPAGTPTIPASKRNDLPAWNDTPMVIDTNRRKTPSIPSTQPITSPFPNAPPPGASPTTAGPPFGGPPPRGSTPGIGPPPKGGPIPRGASPATIGGQYRPQTPSSQLSNAYAPRSPPQAQNIIAPPPPNSSAYAPPPSSAAGPPPSRYTPQAPAQTPSLFAPPLGRPGIPTPSGSTGFAPPPPASTSYNTPPPPQSQGPPPMGGPPRAVSTTGSRPGTQGSQGSAGPPKAATPKPKHPKGDRTHIPDNARPIFENLSAEAARVKSKAPPEFARHVQDMEKRLNQLFDHLNNEELLTAGTIEEMSNLSQALANGDFATAHDLQTEIHKAKTDECGNWMIGVKRLIEMGRATP